MWLTSLVLYDPVLYKLHIALVDLLARLAENFVLFLNFIQQVEKRLNQLNLGLARHIKMIPREPWGLLSNLWLIWFCHIAIHVVLHDHVVCARVAFHCRPWPSLLPITLLKHHTSRKTDFVNNDVYALSIVSDSTTFRLVVSLGFFWIPLWYSNFIHELMLTRKLINDGIKIEHVLIFFLLCDGFTHLWAVWLRSTG